MRALIAVLILVGCGGPPAADCVSPCGMRAYGTEDCDGLAMAEARVLAAFGDRLECQQLRGWALSVAITDLHAIGREGQTWCDFHGVPIRTDDWARSAYAHELAHVQQCPCIIDYSHATWTWQWEAIRQANEVSP